MSFFKKALITGAAAAMLAAPESKAQSFFSLQYNSGYPSYGYGGIYGLPFNNFFMRNWGIFLPRPIFSSYGYGNFGYGNYGYGNFGYVVAAPLIVAAPGNDTTAEREESYAKEPAESQLQPEPKLYNTIRGNFRKKTQAPASTEAAASTEVPKAVATQLSSQGASGPDITIPYDRDGRVCTVQYDDVAARFYEALIRKASRGKQPQIAVSDYGKGDINFVVEGPYTAGKVTIKNKEIPKDKNGIVTSQILVEYLFEKIERVWGNFARYDVEPDFKSAKDKLVIEYFPTHSCKQ